MNTLKSSISYIESVYSALNRIGNIGSEPESGFLRAGYSDEETAAINLIRHHAEELGMTCSFDAIGNFSATTKSRSGRYVEFASHLDTVPYGGNFDGAAGVVAGLDAVRQVVQSGGPVAHGLRLRVWRLEEGSTFNAVCMGSRSAFGMSDPSILNHIFSGKTLQEAIISQGLSPATINNRIPTINQEEVDSILAHLELHIEQANVLEVEKKDIGIVTSIRGPRRTQIEIEGRFDHSGGTPMGVAYRSDANLAIAYMQVRLDQLFTQEKAEACGLVQTVGVVNSSRVVNQRDARVYQNAPPKISGFGYFIFESRGAICTVRDRYHAKALALIEATAKEFGVRAIISELNSSEGIEMLDQNLQQALQNSCQQLEVAWRAIPSGAMHDAAIVAGRRQSSGQGVPVGMIFIPCRNGISHSPDEFTTFEAIAKGACVLANTAQQLTK